MTVLQFEEHLAGIRAQLLVKPLPYRFELEVDGHIHLLSPPSESVNPVCRIAIDYSDLQLLLSGKLNPQAAFVQSRLVIRSGYEGALVLSKVLSEYLSATATPAP